MESHAMGRVIVEARIENLKDAWEVERGLRPPHEARSVILGDALVETGATTLSLPTAVIKQLGLDKRAEKRIRTSAGPASTYMYEPVRLTIMDRDCAVEVMEVPDGVPALVGQTPLEYMDFVVDPRSQRLIGNPAHGGQQVLEMY